MTRTYTNAIYFLWMLFMVHAFACAATDSEEHPSQQQQQQQQQDHVRPFLTRDIQLFGYRLPITPMTIIILILSFHILYSSFTKPSTATASHILLDDHSEETEKRLIQLKQEIGGNVQLFAEKARELSTCPSGKTNGGHLGKFKLGDMVPPFDKAVFSPKNHVGDVIGPIHTQFGWHLIYLHDRDEQRSLIVE